MTFQTAQFGSAALGNKLGDVSAHYGQRATGGDEGKTPGNEAEREAVVDFGTTDKPLYISNTIPAGASVLEILEIGLTGAVATATVGAVDISLAARTTPVDVPLGGELTVTGPTAGKVVVKYVFAKS